VTLEQLGNLGDFVAALATVATLAYLAVQIRASANATRAASHYDARTALNQLNVVMAQDPEWARIWRVAAADWANLSEADHNKFILMMLSMFHVFDTIHYTANAGVTDLGLLRHHEPSIEALLAHAGVRAWWAENPYAYSPEFRAYIEGFIAKAAR